MKEKITYRMIDGVPCRCLDTGADDFEQAEQNRYIIANKLFTLGYVQAEEAVAHTPLKQSLASWIPQGSLPQVGKRDWRQHGGEQVGMYEATEPEGGGDLTTPSGDVV